MKILLFVLLLFSPYTGGHDQTLSPNDTAATRTSEAAYRNAWLKNDGKTITSLLEEIKQLNDGGFMGRQPHHISKLGEKTMKKYFVLMAMAVFTAALSTAEMAQQPQAPSPKMTAASELYKQKKYAESAAAFSDVIKEEPNNGRAWYLLGMSYHSQAKYEQAIAAE